MEPKQEDCCRANEGWDASQHQRPSLVSSHSRSGLIAEQIAPMAPAASKAINLHRYGEVLERAFESSPALVALQISSPGGSPVQSNLLYSRIRSLKKKVNRTIDDG
jgi:ClpP class serine protease